MKRTEQLLFLFAGFLIAVGLVLNINVAMAQGRAPSPGERDGMSAGLPLPSSVFSKLTYQGRLTNASGTPINSPTQMVFKLYADDGTTVLWASAARTVTPVNGLFTVYLGDASDPPIEQGKIGRAASIGLTVGSDSEMTPRQPINSVAGHSFAGSGVEGFSSASVGVYGHSVTGIGVLGESETANQAGVTASNTNEAGVALNIGKGAIQVSGAGQDTSTPLFTHFVHTDATTGNICDSMDYATVIDNPLTNGQSGAILMVTPNYAYLRAGIPPAVGIPAVFYDSAGDCGKGAGKWVIYNLNSVSQVNDSRFNVMVVQP